MLPILSQLKTARLEKKLRQSELGAKLGLPQSHISRIERGETDPRLSTFLDMARLLDYEPVLVPRTRVPAVRALLRGEDETAPMWRVDDEAER